jgi:lambda repressor-like predicted transcriptional regulator
MSNLLPVRHQQEGMSLRKFSEQTGVSVYALQKYCKAGRIIGARKHVLTRKWFIYPPAKLLTGRLL